MPSELDRAAFARVFIDDREHSKHPPVVGAVLDEVLRPDMGSLLGPQADTGPVIEQQSPPSWLLPGHFQARLPPKPLNSLVVDVPTSPSKQGRDPAVAVTAEPRCELDDPANELRLIVRCLELATLCRSSLLEHTTGSSL